MAMTTDDWVILSNGAVAITSIMVAATSEHEAIKALRITTVNMIRAIAHLTPKQEQELEKDESK